MKIKGIILLIAALCISYGNSFSQAVKDNNAPYTPASGTFNLTVYKALKVTSPANGPMGDNSVVFVKGCTYDLVEDESYPENTYTIEGETGKDIFVQINGPTIDQDGQQIKYPDSGTEKVKLTLKWKVINGNSGKYEGDKKAYNLGTRGILTVKVIFRTLVVDSDAPSGPQTFTQTVTASYNSF